MISDRRLQINQLLTFIDLRLAHSVSSIDKGVPPRSEIIISAEKGAFVPKENPTVFPAGNRGTPVGLLQIP